MAWLKVEHSTPDKPEVHAMADALGLDPDAVFGKLLRVWMWADQQTITGESTTAATKVIDRLANVVGFAAAMAKVGWLTITDSRVVFPGFERHNGASAKQRALTAARCAKSREKAIERPPPKQPKAKPPDPPPPAQPIPQPPTETPAKKTRTKTAFVIPTLDEIREYVQSISGSLQPEAFHDYYTANGWVVGKHKMQDWRATVRNWIRRDKEHPDGFGSATRSDSRPPRGGLGPAAESSRNSDQYHELRDFTDGH